ncbi:hypothetical protein F2P56_017962 [Juglans regia]|uniref:Uncharacterized protein n=2 Tax=Juglans regia TaxID=51240 RepID=A0A833X6C6_JUGRE|nr:uncharacterized protein LOC109008472 [Juglans regia]KAF5461902.1 hypothetical protein F2P56_017962 [Juglans regia]
MAMFFSSPSYMRSVVKWNEERFGRTWRLRGILLPVASLWGLAAAHDLSQPWKNSISVSNPAVLARTTSDHSPLIIKTGVDLSRYGPSPFRFQYMWTDHSDFYSFVEGVWKSEGFGYGLVNLSFKLKKIKVALKEWNKRVFGKTDTIIKELEDRIETLDSRLQASFNDEDDKELLKSKLDLSAWRERENTRLAHLTKKSWLKDGDQNSKFFHALLNAKNQRRVQNMCLSNGTVLSTPFEVHKATVDYFQDLLGQSSTSVLPDLNDLISPIITNEENLAIGRVPTIEDVKDALFTIPIESSPEPDGFGSGFFRC